MNKTFIREVPIDRLTDKEMEYFEKQGYEIVWKEDSIEVWAI
jgi:hypothetical protein